MSEGSGGDQRAGMQRGHLLQTPAVTKPSCRNTLCFLDGRVQGLCQLSLKSRPASILLSPRVRRVGSDHRTWFVLTVHGLIGALQSISVLMQ